MSGEVSLGAVKKAKLASDKSYKKHADVLSRPIYEKAEALLKERSLDKALALFLEAQAICDASDAPPLGKVKGPPAETKASEDASNATTKAKPAAASEHFSTQEPPSVTLPAPGSEGHRNAKTTTGENTPAVTYAVNDDAVLQAHLKRTGGAYVTRFPPEPNGYLHLGHAKAMHFDFNVATLAPNGKTFLRFDDTNPTGEKQEYIDSIIESVRWLGHKPARVTYSSDYFEELYNLAVKLIENDKAYVCHQTKAETLASRKLVQAFHHKTKDMTREEKYATPLPQGAESPYRNRPTAESLRLFADMRRGLFAEGEVVLRMKGDLRSDVTAMWDLAAYRVILKAHPRTGDAWCIYPTYDYTHCLVDSLEDITHSLCTLEFARRQAPEGSYYWLLDALDMYKPVTFEFSRCNVTHNVMSKRKLTKLVELGLVDGWDDPRLLTLEGLRRRGYTETAINRFCHDLGVTKSERVCVPYSRLEYYIRNELGDVAPRRFAVIDPIKVVVTNHPGESSSPEIDVPNHPAHPEMGSRKLRFTPVVYIESSDFKREDVKGYFGMAPGKTVRLLYSFDVTCDSIVDDPKDPGGKPLEIRCSYNPDSFGQKPPKGTLHWVGSDAVKADEVRVYSSELFTTEEPGKAPVNGAVADGGAAPAALAAVDDEDQEDEDDEEGGGGAKSDWLTELNGASKEAYANALLEPALAAECRVPEKHFQLQRRGYFVSDRRLTAEGKLVLNMTVSLKESGFTKAVRK